MQLTDLGKRVEQITDTVEPDKVHIVRWIACLRSFTFGHVRFWYHVPSDK